MLNDMIKLSLSVNVIYSNPKIDTSMQKEDIITANIKGMCYPLLEEQIRLVKTIASSNIAVRAILMTTTLFLPSLSIKIPDTRVIPISKGIAKKISYSDSYSDVLQRSSFVLTKLEKATSILKSKQFSSEQAYSTEHLNFLCLLPS